MSRTVSALNVTSKNWQQRYDCGCEWCGGKIPSIDLPNSDGFVTYGLQFAHIFARAYAPETQWNGLLLCPSCHVAFDRVLKPKLTEAIRTAITGFPYQPTPLVPASTHVVGNTYEEVLDRLVNDPQGATIPLPPVNAALPKVTP